MCTTSHSSHPTNPPTCNGPILATAREAGDHGQRPEVAVAEGLGRLAVEAAHDGVGGVDARLHGHLGHAGQVVERHQVADDEHLGMCPGREQSGLTTDPAGLVDLRPGRLASDGPRPAARVPAAQTLVAAGIRSSSRPACVISTPSSSMSVTMASRWISTPMRVRSRSVMRDSVAPHRRDQPVLALDQDDAGVDGVDQPVVAPQRPPRELASAGRPSPRRSGRRRRRRRS